MNNIYVIERYNKNTKKTNFVEAIFESEEEARNFIYDNVMWLFSKEKGDKIITNNHIYTIKELATKISLKDSNKYKRISKKNQDKYIQNMINVYKQKMDTINAPNKELLNDKEKIANVIGIIKKYLSDNHEKYIKFCKLNKFYKKLFGKDSDIADIGDIIEGDLVTNCEIKYINFDLKEKIILKVTFEDNYSTFAKLDLYN